MTPPTKHLEIFDEKFVDKFMDINGNFAYERMKDHGTQDSWEVKRHLIQTVISVLEEQIREVVEGTWRWNGKTDDQSVDKALANVIDSLTANLLGWKSLEQ